MKEMYGQLLPYVNHRADLNYLLDNMGAEIAIGHSYVRGGDMPEVPPSTRRPARRRLHDRERPLQDRADLRHRELESRAARAAGRARRERLGRRLHRRDQRCRAESAGQHLSAARRHGRTTDGANGQQQARRWRARRIVTVVPVANEQTLRTRAWVESNRRLVDKLSNGQLAYVYLPNTGQPGYTQLQSLLLRAAGQVRRDHRRALQRRRLGGRLHHRHSAARSSTATSITSPAIAIRSRVRRPGSGDRR